LRCDVQEVWPRRADERQHRRSKQDHFVNIHGTVTLLPGSKTDCGPHYFRRRMSRSKFIGRNPKVRVPTRTDRPSKVRLKVVA
jgi:hypothetical protein